MDPLRTLFFLVLLLGLASAGAFHASGALDEQDALTAATLRHGIGDSPPLPLTSRSLALGVDLVRLVWAPTGLFRAMHLGAGMLLALAAALSAVAAFHLTVPRSGRFAAGLLVGFSTLFGAGLASLGMKGGPLPTVIALLAGAGVAWSARVPWAFTGGVLLGAATAEHPLVLFVIPAFVVLANERRTDSAFWGRAGGGFALGALAVFLPVLDSLGRPLVDFGDPTTPARALALWWGSSGEPFWQLAGPSRWGGGLLELAISLGGNAGPVGLGLGVIGIAILARRAERLRSIVLPASLPALALIFGTPRDAAFAAALTAWIFVFATVPAVAALAARFESARAALLLPAVAFASALLLITLGSSSIDRSSEKGVGWARDSFAPLPEGALLLTNNPVHLALASEAERPDLDVVYVPRPSTLRARRSGQEVHAPSLPSGGALDGDLLNEVVGLNRGARPVMLEPNLFFDTETRARLVGSRWRTDPHGLAYRVRGIDETLSRDEEAQIQEYAQLWGGFDLHPGTPPSPLREGLSGGEFYARSLLQSAAVFLEQKRLRDAEREFLFALTLEEANTTIAAYGLARVLFEDENYSEAVAVLERYVRDEDPGAWDACRLLATAHLRLGSLDEGIETLERALRLSPEHLVQERQSLKNLIQSVRERRDRIGPREE